MNFDCAQKNFSPTKPTEHTAHHSHDLGYLWTRFRRICVRVKEWNCVTGDAKATKLHASHSIKYVQHVAFQGSFLFAQKKQRLN